MQIAITAEMHFLPACGESRWRASKNPVRCGVLAPAERSYLLAESRHDSDCERDEKDTGESSNWHRNTGGTPVRFWQ